MLITATISHRIIGTRRFEETTEGAQHTKCTILLSDVLFFLLNMIEIQDNWEHISKTWGSGFLITRFVSAIVSPVCLFLPPFSSVVSSQVLM